MPKCVQMALLMILQNVMVYNFLKAVLTKFAEFNIQHRINSVIIIMQLAVVLIVESIPGLNVKKTNLQQHNALNYALMEKLIAQQHVMVKNIVLIMEQVLLYIGVLLQVQLIIRNVMITMILQEHLFVWILVEYKTMQNV